MQSISEAPVRSWRAAPHLATCSVRFARILVATDFSKESWKAISTAIAVSQLFAAKLYLVHAADMLTLDSPGADPPSAEALRRNLDTLRVRLKNMVLADPWLNKLKPEITVAYAAPVDLIQEVANREKIDLIVVGSHGAGRLEHLALGSVAETVLRKSSRPVLIVGPQCKLEANPFCSILLATDMAPTSLRAAQYAAALAEGSRGKLTMLHVIRESPAWSLLSSVFPGDRSSGEEQLEVLLPVDVAQHCKPKVRVEYGDPAEVIVRVAREECAGLVVVGLKDRSAFAHSAPWSTLSQLLRDLHCPTLGVRGHIA